MKKLLLLALTLSLLVVSLSGCFITDMIFKEEETEPTSKTFDYNKGFNITLPPEFEQTSSPMARDLVIQSDDHLVHALPTAFSNITPKEGFDFPTLEIFFSESGVLGETFIPMQIQEIDGFKTIEFDTNDNGKIDTLFILMETETAYWAIKFQPTSKSTVPYEDAKPLYLEWAKTISFKLEETTEK